MTYVVLWPRLAMMVRRNPKVIARLSRSSIGRLEIDRFGWSPTLSADDTEGELLTSEHYVMTHALSRALEWAVHARAHTLTVGRADFAKHLVVLWLHTPMCFEGAVTVQSSLDTASLSYVIGDKWCEAEAVVQCSSVVKHHIQWHKVTYSDI